MVNNMKKDKLIKEIRSWIITIIVGLGVALFVNAFVLRTAKIQGSSMAETLKDGEFGITSVFHAKFLNVKRFDIVVIDEQELGYWVKRVVGLPNDTIEYRSGVLYVNQEKIDESFLNKSFDESIAPIQLKEDEYYVLGDNRKFSTDSRVIGPIKKESIKSVGFFVLWPLNKIGVK